MLINPSHKYNFLHKLYLGLFYALFILCSHASYATQGVSENNLLNIDSMLIEADKLRSHAPALGQEIITKLENNITKLSESQRHHLTYLSASKSIYQGNYLEGEKKFLALLVNMRQGKKEGQDYEKQKKSVIDMIVGDSKLRNKRVLIEKFIDKNLFELDEKSDITDAYKSFLDEEQTQAMNILCEEENLNKELFEKMISKYIFKKDMPRSAEILGLVMTKLKLKEKKALEEKLKVKISDFIEIFLIQ